MQITHFSHTAQYYSHFFLAQSIRMSFKHHLNNIYLSKFYVVKNIKMTDHQGGIHSPLTESQPRLALYNLLN